MIFIVIIIIAAVIIIIVVAAVAVDIVDVGFGIDFNVACILNYLLSVNKFLLLILSFFLLAQLLRLEFMEGNPTDIQRLQFRDGVHCGSRSSSEVFVSQGHFSRASPAGIQHLEMLEIKFHFQSSAFILANNLSRKFIA